MNLNDQPMRDHQFGLRDIVLVTTAAALGLAYARSWGTDTLLHSVWFALAVIVAGTLVGVCWRNWRDAYFWSAMLSVMTFVAVAGGTLPNAGVILGWGVVAAMCGAIGSVPVPRSLAVGCVVGSWLAASAMSASVLAMRESLSGVVMFDVGCAALMGAVMRLAIDFLRWLEMRSQQPRVLLATWLVLCVLLGNFLVPIVGGVAR